MIRWGILGAGNIANRFAVSLKNDDRAELVAISCRTLEKGNTFAKKHNVNTVYLSHNELLEDKEIDAIYLALPHGLHHEWCIKAIEAGKAVLCEKPVALNAKQVKDIVKKATDNNVLFMEAMKSRFVPAYKKMMELIEAGKIGEIESVEASLCNDMPFPADNKTYHTEPGQGGVLLDCGIYCTSLLEQFSEGKCTVDNIECDVRNTVDYYVKADLNFENIAGKIETAFTEKKPRTGIITGTKGKIILDELHRSQKLTLCENGEEEKVFEIPYDVDDFYSEISHFNDLLLAGKTESDVMSYKSSIRCAEIIDEIKAKF